MKGIILITLLLLDIPKPTKKHETKQMLLKMGVAIRCIEEQCSFVWNRSLNLQDGLSLMF